MRAATIAIVVAAATLAPAAARAHGMRSVYIDVTERTPTRAQIAIRGKVAVTGVGVTAAAPCAITESPDTGRWLECPDGLAGAELAVTGLGTIASEAVIHATLLDGAAASACVTPGAPTWTLPGAAPGALAIASRYVGLGVRHIASGLDHLLFLLALALCLRRVRAVLLAETAFTLSHTLSFSASALGWIHVSAPAAEACIAASLVLVALDVGRPSREAPWQTAALAFAFGLVHGLGFASGLGEIGLPATEIPAALAGFAAGVECGQVAFLALVLSTLWLVRRAPRVGAALDRGLTLAGAYAIGGVGCCWFLERLTFRS